MLLLEVLHPGCCYLLFEVLFTTLFWMLLPSAPWGSVPWMLLPAPWGSVPFCALNFAPSSLRLCTNLCPESCSLLLEVMFYPMPWMLLHEALYPLVTWMLFPDPWSSVPTFDLNVDYCCYLRLCTHLCPECCCLLLMVLCSPVLLKLFPSAPWGSASNCALNNSPCSLRLYTHLCLECCSLLLEVLYPHVPWMLLLHEVLYPLGSWMLLPAPWSSVHTCALNVAYSCSFSFCTHLCHLCPECYSLILEALYPPVPWMFLPAP